MTSKETEVWRGAEVVMHWGDPEAEYQGIRNGVVLVDRDERETWVATGQDVVKLIQGLVTGNVFSLAPEGAGMMTTAVNVKGRFVTDLRLLHILDILILDLEPGQTAAGAVSHFKNHVITEDAKFHDRRASTARLGVFGPGAAEALEAAGRFSVRLKNLAPFHGTSGRIGADGVVVQATPITGGAGFELYVPRESKERIERVLLRTPGMVRAGHLAMERARIEAGIPRFGVEMDEKIIPLEADMNYAIAYDKGCYLGQEVIARLDTRGVPAKLLRRLVIEGQQAPALDSEISHDGKVVGEVRSVAKTGDGAWVAMGYLKRDHNEPGMQVEIGELRAVVAPLSA